MTSYDLHEGDVIIERERLAELRATIVQLHKEVADLAAANQQLRADLERFKAALADSPLPEGM